jgi:peptidoglycan/LPS O-acetylase OafA/YrhL
MSAVLSVQALGRAYPLAAWILVTGSGLLMLGVGDAFAQGGWSHARPLALAGGGAIQVALAFERRGVRLRWQRSTIAGRSLPTQLASSGLVLVAGAALVMIAAISRQHGWWPIGFAAVIPVVALIGALSLNRRAAVIRLNRNAAIKRRRHISEARLRRTDAPVR